MRDQVKKIAGSIVDVTKDCNNSYVYLGNAFKSIKAWELGMLYFVGIYTMIGMFLPALAYAIIFDCLIKSFIFVGCNINDMAFIPNIF